MIVKIFVSSLFREMAVERDLLHRQVSALLADRFGGRDITPDFIDFRWGLDDSALTESRDKSRFIIRKCFEAIDDCDLFLAIIGREYGSLADRDICAELLPTAAPERDFSFTDMELEYAKATLPPSRILFLHTPVSPEDDAEVVRIKREFCAAYACAAYEKGEGTVSPAFLSGAVTLVADAAEHLDTVAPGRSEYFLREELLAACRATVGKHNLVFLKGSSGCGKSVLLRILGERLRQDPALEVYSAVDARGAARDIRTLLGSLFDLSGSYPQMLRALAAKITASPRQVVLLLDDIDGFGMDDVYALYEATVSIPADKLCLVFCSARPRYHEYFADLCVHHLPVGDLSPVEVRGFLAHICARYNKEAPAEVLDYIAEKGGNFANPLYLSMLMNRLITLDTEKYQSARSHGVYTEGIVAQMKEVVDSCPAELEEIIAWNLTDLDRFIYPRFSSFLFTAMSVYQKPLPLPTVKRLYGEMFGVEWSELDYYTYRYYLREFCDTGDNTLSFRHDIIRRLIHTRICADVDFTPYYAAFSAVLEASAEDGEMLRYFRILLEDDRFAEGTVSARGCAQITAALLRVVSGELDGELSEVTLPLFRTLLRLTQYADAAQLFLRMLNGTALYGRLDEAGMLFRRVFDTLFHAQMPAIHRAEVLGGMLDFANSTGLEGRFTDLPQKYLRLVGSIDAEYLKSRTALLLEGAYVSARLCRSTDREQEFRALVPLAAKLLSLCERLNFCAPLVVEMLCSLDDAEAERLCRALIQKHEGSSITAEERQILGNLYYRLHGLLAGKEQVEEAEQYALACYRIFASPERDGTLSSKQLYDYTLGLSAYGFHCFVRHKTEEEAETYERLFSIRNHLAKTEPDNFVVLSALTNTVLSILARSIPVKTPLDSMLESLTEHMFRYAVRGNARVGWLFAHFFKDTLRFEKNGDILPMMLDKFKRLDLMLCPVIAQNRLNPENLAELVHVYLDIYSAYCNKRILPLEEGKQLLARLAEAGREAVRACPSEATFDLYYKIYLEVHTVFLQQSNKMMFTESELYKTESAFMKECESLPQGDALTLFLTLQPASEILTYVYLYQDLEAQGRGQLRMFLSVMREAGVDMFGEIRRHTLEIFRAVTRVPGCRHTSLDMLLLGYHFLQQNAPELTADPEMQRVFALLQSLKS